MSHSGNMWAADCSYVNKLHEPKVFEDRMTDFIKKVLIYKIWTRFKFGIVPVNVKSLGLGGYGMEHWVGSHPTLLPCDVSNNVFSYYYTQDRSTSKTFSINYGAHLAGSAFNYDKEAELRVRAEESARVSEFSFLAGFIQKWFMLYNGPPPASSWVWTYFPDGNRWSIGIEAHGSDAVRAIASEFELSEAEVNMG
jgi:hypothetical protein